MAGVHEDFGEKIGGAKKDLWKDRGLYVDDLDAMNDREAEKFVKKDNIWKKPDYQAMLDEGVPLGVVYFIKKARDSLNASPAVLPHGRHAGKTACQTERIYPDRPGVTGGGFRDPHHGGRHEGL